ncbi:class I SAM-dependent DNA methyltransferase [Dongshaea marina]|uniref:class I SAM-dependent DNA methyltransferase n=1 Tax=Dongshaea marina TaxID=2047966 RepID=UPI000D3EA8B0|nr:class I SAM-dependent methyltransferase [Dongshaea marina]
MKNPWDEYAQGWDLDPSVQEYAAKAFEELLSSIKIDDLSVFDFGCGTGALTQLLSPRVKEIVALDASPEMIKHLLNKKLTNVSAIADFLTQELIEHNPDLANKFDLILASSVCGFLADYEMTLGLIKSLMKPGGIFVQWDWLARDETSQIGLSEHRVLSALQAHGFTEITLTKPFEMNSSKGLMTVLMAIGKNTA